jgi:RNA polymerase sigma factor (sigma-70 family)
MKDRHAVATRGVDFNDAVMPHLNAGYRLALWLLRNAHDAEDVVQEASLRAFRYFGSFTGRDGRAWFLRIVRNVCRDLHDRRGASTPEPFDETRHLSDRALDPEMLALRTDNVKLVERTLKALPESYRVLLVLREIEDLSYREVADVLEVPMGTVMSGLSRARQAFRRALDEERKRLAI